MDLTKLHTLSSKLGDILVSKKLYFTCAESCTGGWVGKTVTSVRGSSRWFGCGFITYSNSSKQEILDVSDDTLKNFGAVSEQVVKEMVLGALNKSAAGVYFCNPAIKLLNFLLSPSFSENTFCFDSLSINEICQCIALPGSNCIGLAKKVA